MQFETSYPSKYIKQEDIQKLIHALENEHLSTLSTPYASVSLPYIPVTNEIYANGLNYDFLIIIGIGGSNLGTMAILDALKDTPGTKKKIFFLDTVDSFDISQQIEEILEYLKKGLHGHIDVISKSGSTTETMAIFEYLYSNIILTYRDQCNIRTISDKNSKLDRLSKDQNWNQLHLPHTVGGRFSVFSNVGLGPLFLGGIDVDELLAGARQSIEDYISQPEIHPSMIMGYLLYEEFLHGRNIVEHFFFSKRFENIGKWYRQLLGESIGKIRSDGSSVGITPTTSIGTIDLHSVGQLNLAHTQDRTIHLIRINTSRDTRSKDVPFEPLVENIRENSLEQIMEGAIQGFHQSIEKKGIPNSITTIEEGSAFDIGYFLQTKMLEVMFLGILFDINPFDQPNVEEYKKGMREYLKNQ